MTATVVVAPETVAVGPETAIEGWIFWGSISGKYGKGPEFFWGKKIGGLLGRTPIANIQYLSFKNIFGHIQIYL